MNVSTGEMEDRILITGLHTVADIHCNCCETVLGWKYVRLFFLSLSFFSLRPACLTGKRCTQEHAFEHSQKYKEGKFILEKALIEKDFQW